MRTLLVNVLRWVLLAGPIVNADAASLPVNNANPAGCNDVGGNPFCTISAAINRAMPQDVVLVAPGVYHEALQIRTDDLQVLAGTVATIDGSGIIVRPLDGLVQIDAIGVVFIGFEVRGSNQMGIHARPLLTGSCAGVLIEENQVHHNASDGIAIGIGTGGCEDAQIDNNTVANNGGTGISISGGGTNFVVLNRMSANGGDGVTLFMSQQAHVLRNRAINNLRVPSSRLLVEFAPRLFQAQL